MPKRRVLLMGGYRLSSRPSSVCFYVFRPHCARWCVTDTQRNINECNQNNSETVVCARDQQDSTRNTIPNFCHTFAFVSDRVYGRSSRTAYMDILGLRSSEAKDRQTWSNVIKSDVLEWQTAYTPHFLETSAHATCVNLNHLTENTFHTHIYRSKSRGRSVKSWVCDRKHAWISP